MTHIGNGTEHNPYAVVIEHPEYGRMEGAIKTGYRNWTVKGARYLEADGWREVRPKRWVPVNTEITREGKTLVAWVNDPETYPMHFHVGKGYRWKSVEIEKEVEG